MKIQYCKKCGRETSYTNEGDCYDCYINEIKEESGLTLSQIRYEDMAWKEGLKRPTNLRRRTSETA